MSRSRTSAASCRTPVLLAAAPDRFAAAIVEIDRNLTERATELLRTRERIARLKAGG